MRAPMISVAFVVLLSVLAAQRAEAVAYCALRDPVATIYEMFPEADNYRTNVRTVDRNARHQVLKALSIPLHFNELGRHSLYIAQRGTTPLGFVHARSELGEWGIVEYAFAIGLDQTIRAATVQRARDPTLLHKDALSPYLTSIIGVSLAEIREQLAALKAANASELQQSLIASAAKTLAITRIVWSDEVALGQAQSMSTAIAPNVQVTQIGALFPSAARRLLTENTLTTSAAFERQKMAGYQVLDSSGAALGLVAKTNIDSIEPDLRVWWTLSKTGEVLAIQPGLGRQLPPELSAVVGFAPKQARDCSNLAELAALELALLSRHHTR